MRSYAADALNLATGDKGANAVLAPWHTISGRVTSDGVNGIVRDAIVREVAMTTDVVTAVSA